VPEQVGGITVPTHEAGTVISVPDVVTDTEIGVCVQTTPLTRKVCACAALIDAIDDKASSGINAFDIRIQMFFI
jgi:hypothetical protein